MFDRMRQLRYLDLLALLSVLVTVTVMILLPTGAQASCQEDQPCWNWATMGNQHRGVVTLYGNSRVVNPCQFRRLWQMGHLRYHVTVDGKTYHTLDKMLGDITARKYGCTHKLHHVMTFHMPDSIE
jgi:hypothetical protein